MKENIYKINFNKIISIVITIVFISLTFFVFPNSFGRLLESFRDFGLSVAYYFNELIDLPGDVTVTVTSLPQIPFFDFLINYKPPVTTLPERFEEFRELWVKYWHLFIAKENVIAYSRCLVKFLYITLKILLLVLPFIFVFIFLFKRTFSKQNNEYNKDSKALKVYKNISNKVFKPCKTAIISFLNYVNEHKFKTVWLLIWLFNFNIFTIILEFLAFYLYFIFSFDISNVYIQVYKLALDLWAMIDFVPFFVWLILGILLFDRWRKKIGYSILRHNEMKNRGFINELPIVEMNCGSMGKKKTTLLTDMALSLSVMLKDKAFEKILENDLKFPNFPWINLENELKRAIRFHQVYNLATTKIFVHKKFDRWFKENCREKIFDYDYEKYGLTYDDKLKIQSVWEVIEIYSQLYFIYVIESSMILSNYSIRTDILLSDIGNFPIHNTDFFQRDSRLIDSFSRHSHILDFDCLRLGKKLVEDNKLKDSFEFGVVVITEVGKERKNMLELKELKKKEEVTNQKNDGFNDWLKMVRHSATVDNFPFVKVITDEQRPESWGADARDLCQIVNVEKSTETRLAMPFFFVGELLYDFVFSRFVNLYYEYRFNRGDNTLLMYWLKNIVAKIERYYKGIYNTFGYCVLNVNVESGTQTGEAQAKKYFLANKKIYSKRFSTDCFSDFYLQKSLRSHFGLNDIAEYETEKATFEELKKQNSYFINDLIKRD